MTLKKRAQQLKTDIPALFLAIKQKQTPWLAKVLAGLTLAYALSPIDLIPDFIPVLGYLDDIIILPVMVYFTIKLIPPDVLQDCRNRAKDLWAAGKPKKWYYALPIIVVWLFVLWLILRTIFNRS